MSDTKRNCQLQSDISDLKNKVSPPSQTGYIICGALYKKKMQDSFVQKLLRISKWQLKSIKPSVVSLIRTDHTLVKLAHPSCPFWLVQMCVYSLSGMVLIFIIYIIFYYSHSNHMSLGDFLTDSGSYAKDCIQCQFFPTKKNVYQFWMMCFTYAVLYNFSSSFYVDNNH